ncbi:SET and MYND domain-containing protein 2 [Diplocarpon rosae]|nr:SET and MYND domain-containing protein 2 [Diplocarpon rosae]
MPKSKPVANADKEDISTLPAHKYLDRNYTHRIETPQYGSGLAASSPFSPGSLILKLYMPNLLLVERDSLSRVCSFCIQECQSMKRCSACKIPYYCHKSCQNRHWREIHSQECRLLRKLPDVPPTAVRSLIVMLLKNKDQLDSGEEMDWTALESHFEELQQDRKRWEEILMQARAGIEFTKSEAERMGEAVRWLCVLSTNAFRITLPDNTPVGLCFSPTLARANHSCNPNAFIVFDSRHISLRALRTIKTDEQIYISYIDPTEDVISRQSRLKERYFFTCKCEKCERNENAYDSFLSYQLEEEEDYDKRMDVFCAPKQLLLTARHLATTIQSLPLVSEYSNPLRKASSLLEKSRNLSEAQKQCQIPTIIDAASLCKPLTDAKLYALSPYPEIMHGLYLAYVDAQSFVFALITILFLFLKSDVFTYPQPHHPVRVIRLFTIAKLLKHIASLSPNELLQDISQNSSRSPRAALQLSEDIWKAVQDVDLINAFHAIMILVWEEAKKSHGEDSNFMKEVEQEIQEAEEVQRLRGPVGKSLRGWMGDVKDAAGRTQAQICFDGLQRLAGLAERFMSP